MWMFIEGYYLHNLVVVTIFPSNLNYTVYYVAGWGQSHCLSVPFASVSTLGCALCLDCCSSINVTHSKQHAVNCSRVYVKVFVSNEVFS